MSNQSMVFKLTSNKKERFELCPSSFDPKYIIDWYDIQKLINNNKHFKFNPIKSTILSLGPRRRPTPSPRRSPSPKRRPTPRRSPSPRKSLKTTPKRSPRRSPTPRRSLKPSPRRSPTPRRSPSPRKSLKTTPRKSLKTTPRKSLNRKYSLLYPYGSPLGTPPPAYSFLYPHSSSKGKQPRASPRIQGSLYQDLLRHHKNAVEV